MHPVSLERSSLDAWDGVLRHVACPACRRRLNSSTSYENCLHLCSQQRPAACVHIMCKELEQCDMLSTGNMVQARAVTRQLNTLQGLILLQVTAPDEERSVRVYAAPAQTWSQWLPHA